MKKLNELRTSVDELRDEIVKLSEIEDITPEQDARLTEAATELPVREAALEAEEARAQIVERAKSAPRAQRAADSSYVHDPLGEPESIRDNSKLWDLEAVAAEMRSNDPERGLRNLSGRAVDAVERAAGLTDAQKDHVTRFVDALGAAADDDAEGARRVTAHIIATSSPEYMRAWSKALKTAIRHGSADPQAMGVLSRAMSLTDGAGGYAVPLPVDPTLVPNYDVNVNPFRSISTQRTIVGDQLRTVNSTAASFSWDGEAAEVSDDATTFANIDIPVHKAQGFIPFSIEISQDYPGFTQDVRGLLSDGRDNLEATAHATGTGTNQPTGIVTALTGGSFVVASAAADTFAVGDLYALEEALPAQARSRASWVANKAIYNDIRQFGTADSHALWERLGAGQPNELLGYQTYESPTMDGTVTALADNYVAILGDFSNYWIVDRVGLSMELVPHLFATANNRPSGQRGFYAYWRTGADSVNDRRFRMLNVT